MNRPIDKLEAEALELSTPERARLASLLLASLEADSDVDPEAVDHAWAAEMQRRVRDIRSGETKLVPAEDVLKKLRNRHA